MTHDEILNLYSAFVAIPSISTNPDHRSDMQNAVAFLKEQLESCGATVTVFEREGSHPCICARIDGDTSKPTIGIYAHYDVQPPEPLDQWESDPFTLTVKNEKMYGRGTADDKGHIVQVISALKHLKETAQPHGAIVCLFEGEEEIGSTSFEAYCEQNRAALERVDVWYVLDVGMSADRSPQIFYGLRGLLYFELRICTGSRDLHSGIYGNRVLNPAQVASHLFATMKDSETQRVLIPHFYDDVRTIDDTERALLQKAFQSDDDIAREANNTAVHGVADTPAYLAPKILPSLDINGIDGGYIGEGQKTIIPSVVRVKFSCRLVEYQQPDRIIALVKEYIASHLPKGVEHTLNILSVDPPFYTSFDNEFVRKTAQILEEQMGKPVIYNRSGGSIPAAETLERLFAKPVILTGFTMPDENIHSPNENFDEQNFWKGVKIMTKLFLKL